MKYLITESQKENIIKKYILSNFDNIDDVWFEKRDVYYGKEIGYETDRGIDTVITVLVDNMDNELSEGQLRELKRNIINKTENTFNLGYNRYRSGWNFNFLKKIIVKF